MILNYLKITIRKFYKDFRFSLINLAGLSLGMFCFMIIVFYISFETGFDRFHKNSDNIYRMGWAIKSPDATEKYSVTTAQPAPDMYESFPEISGFCRFSMLSEGYLGYLQEDFFTENFLFADSGFFDLFDYELIIGNPETCLRQPYSILLTQSMAEKIFHKDNPIGESLSWNNEYDFIVTGILKDPPSDSHLQFSVLASFSSLYEIKNAYLGWNGGVGYFSYLLFEEGKTPKDLDEKLEQLYFDNINQLYEQGGWKIVPFFEPLKDIHLKANSEGQIGRRGNPANNRLFLIIAIIILCLACINFMNLSTARYSTRTRELGVRKVFGASRRNIILQYYGESLLMVCIACIPALILLEALLPVIQRISGSEFSIYSRGNLPVIIALPLIIFLTGAIAGSYPSLFLSSFSPVSILKGKINPGKKNLTFRNILVIIQFTAGSALIICTLIIGSQLNYIRNKDLGFDKNNILVLPMTSIEFRQNLAVLQEEIGKLSGVISTTATDFIPGIQNASEGYIPEGSDNSLIFNRISVDYNYIETMGLAIKTGRSFSEDFSTDKDAFIINEALARKMGWDNPLEKSLTRDGTHPVIGVVKDFNYSKLASPISPLIINLKPFNGYNYLLVKTSVLNHKELIRKIRSIWKEFDSNEPFDYHFLDKYIENEYESERKFGNLFITASILSLLIAALGLFGLSSFEAEKRKKEIGIRKVLGSTVNKITSGFIKKFFLLVVISNFIAWPIAWKIMNNWLNTFEFRTEIKASNFIAALLISMLIALITVWSRTYKIANMNPADAIRCE